LWKSFDGKKSLIIENGKLKINNNFGLSSAISDQVYQDLNKFLDKNKSRSILFYGPPGSGKSKAIAKVVNDLNLSCLYFDTSEIETIKSSIKLSTMLNPDIIILEDLDHVYDLDFLLHFVEEFRKKPKKIIFGSANIVTKLDDAFQRPERFDKLIELQRLDNSIILNIVHNDLSILEITKSWPISYVKELMERIDVLGKEEALKSIGDLELRIKNLSITNYSNNRTSDVDFNE
jgi:SpoVK/Ycf46/Vps4 family AAA+-type ATPase